MEGCRQGRKGENESRSQERYAQASYPDTERETTKSSVKLKFADKVHFDLVPMFGTPDPERQIIVRLLELSQHSKDHFEARIVAPGGQGPSREVARLEGRTILGFTGYMRDWHGLNRVVDLIADNRQIEGLHFLVIGDGPARSWFERQMPSGATGTAWSCARCHTRIYAENGGRPGIDQRTDGYAGEFLHPAVESPHRSGRGSCPESRRVPTADRWMRRPPPRAAAAPAERQTEYRLCQASLPSRDPGDRNDHGRSAQDQCGAGRPHCRCGYRENFLIL